MLREVHRALVGTLKERGLARRLEDVESKIDLHIESDNLHVAQSALSSTRFLYDAARSAVSSVLALVAASALALFWLGLKISVGQ